MKTIIVVALECYYLVLVREFESRRGEILDLLAKIQKDQLNFGFACKNTKGSTAEST